MSAIHQLDLGLGDVHVPSAGTFRKGYANRDTAPTKKVDVHGIDVRIDRPKGFVQHGIAADGSQWQREYSTDYGFIPKTKGGDDEGLDVFVGPNPQSERAFWVWQKKLSGAFDEFKLMLGYDSPTAAKKAYLAHVPSAFFQSMHEGTVHEIKGLLGRDPTPERANTETAAAKVVKAAGLANDLDGVTAMSEISGKARDALPSSSFALPAQRKYPLHDAAHTRNAAARLEQEKAAGKISSADYTSARRRIARAAKKFGVASEYNKAKKGITVRARIAHGGELHVRHHMSATESLVYGAGVELDAAVALAMKDASAAPARVWNQLAVPGHFEGHAAGPFDLNNEIFQQIRANFLATRNRAIPIDFDHASTQPPAEGTKPIVGAPAQGWIHDLKIENGALWGLVEWGDLAREYVLNRNYKFFSPAIVFKTKDRVTGKPAGARLVAVALTNDPFLDGMQPLAASALAGAPPANAVSLGAYAHAPDEYMPKVRGALKLSDVATARECAEQLDRVREHLDSVGGDHTQSPQGVPLSDYAMALRELVDAAPGSTWDEIFEVVEDLIAEAIEQHERVYHEASASRAEPTIDAANNTNDTSATSARGEETMTPEQTKALADAEAKVITLSAQATNLTTQHTELTTQLSSAKTELNSVKLDLKERDTEIATLKTENATLLSAQAARAAADATARVAEAFETYKDSKKLGDDDKESMAIELSANPERFEKRYPRVAGSQQHMLRNLSGGGDGKSQVKVGEGGNVISLRQLSQQIAAQRKIPIAQAQIIAEQMRKKAAR